MNSQFLYQLFRAAELPQPVFTRVLDRYASRYLPAFVQNRRLGPTAASLATWLLANEDSKSMITLIHTDNFHVVSALLAHSGVLPDSVLFAAVDTWNLEADTASQLAVHAGDPKMANYLQSAVYNGQPGSRRETVLRCPVSPDAPAPVATEHVINQLLRLCVGEVYAELWQSAGPVPQILSAQLGQGATERSLDAWLCFLSLAEDNHTAPLQTVLDTALCLSLC